MATVQVKATKADGRVAFFERDKAHPGGQGFVRGDGKAVEVADTPELARAIRQQRVVVVQAAPATAQTPSTKTQGGKGKPAGEQTPPPGPLDGLGLTAEQQKTLTEAGLGDRAKLAAATDDDLIAIPTIGQATVENLRRALAGN